jgi:hypothetical protein
VPRRAARGFWVQGVKVASGEAVALLAEGRRRVVCFTPKHGEVHVSAIPSGTALEIPSIGTLCHSEHWRRSRGVKVDVALIASTLRPRARTAYLTRAAATRDDLQTMVTVLADTRVPQRTLAAMLRRNAKLQPALVRCSTTPDASLSYLDFTHLLTDAHAIELLAQHLRLDPWPLTSVCHQFAKRGFLESYRRWVGFLLTEYVNTERIHVGLLLRQLLENNRTTDLEATAALTEAVLDAGSESALQAFSELAVHSDTSQLEVVAAVLKRRRVHAASTSLVARTGLLLERRSAQLRSHPAHHPASRRFSHPKPTLQRPPRKSSVRHTLEHTSLQDLAAQLQDSTDSTVLEVATERGVLNPQEALASSNPRVRAAAVAHISDQGVLATLTNWAESPSVLFAVIAKSRSIEALETLIDEAPNTTEQPVELAELTARVLERSNARLGELRLMRLVLESTERSELVVARAVISQFRARDLLCELTTAAVCEISQAAAERLQAVTFGPRT